MSININQDIITAVKDTADCIELAEWLGFDVKKRGGGVYFILCPAHNDENPSCRVNKDYVYCYSCLWHGDAIDFVSKVKGWSYVQTVTELCIHYGIPIQSSETVIKPKPTVVFSATTLQFLGINVPDKLKQALAESPRETLKYIYRLCVTTRKKIESLLTHSKGDAFICELNKRKVEITFLQEKICSLKNKNVDEYIFRIKSEG